MFQLDGSNRFPGVYICRYSSAYHMISNLKKIRSSNHFFFSKCMQMCVCVCISNTYNYKSMCFCSISHPKLCILRASSQITKCLLLSFPNILVPIDPKPLDLSETSSTWKSWKSWKGWGSEKQKTRAVDETPMGIFSERETFQKEIYIYVYIYNT